MSISVTDQELIFEFSKLIGNKCVRQTNLDKYDRKLRQELITREVLEDLKDFKQESVDKKLLTTFIKSKLFSRKILSHSSRMRYEIIIFFKHTKKMDEYKRQRKKGEVNINSGPNEKETEVTQKEINRVKDFLNPEKIKDNEEVKRMDSRSAYRPQFDKGKRYGYRLPDFHKSFNTIPKVVREDVDNLTSIENEDRTRELERRKLYWTNNMEVKGFKEMTHSMINGVHMQPCVLWAHERKGKATKGCKEEFEDLHQEIQEAYIQKAKRMQEKVSEEGNITFPMKMLKEVKEFMRGRKKEEEERKASKRKVPVWDDDGDYKEESIDDFNKTFKSA